MFQFEKKIITWINQHMIHIAIFFVLFAAAWMRLGGRNYIGIDFHYSLYDIPGNCNSFLYRFFVNLLMRMDYAIILLKLLAYLGDFLVAFLSVYIFWQEGQCLMGLRTYLVLSACLLSPVALLYSVANMEIDSVCMFFILLGFLLYKKNKIAFAAISISIAPMLYPAYYPVALGVLFFLLSSTKEKTSRKNLFLSVGIFAGFLLASIVGENILSTDNYFWGKIFIVNPATESAYANLFLWLKGMTQIYGYILAFGSLLLAVKHRKMRIVTLVIHVLVIMIVGWEMTSHFAV